MTKSYHFIGIGGVGMSALAHILLNKGAQVSGSDVKESSTIEVLRKKGAKIFLKQSKENIQKEQIVVYSTAIKSDNLEFAEAKRIHCLMVHRSELLQELLGEKKELVVVGAHGKTSTTSLLAHVMTVAGLDPSYAIGGFSPSLYSNGRGGEGEYFCIEGDESDGSFLNTSPFGAIVNNIDSDHVGYYWKSYDDLLKAYKKFISMVSNKDLLIYNGDDKTLRSWGIEGVSCGFGANNQVRADRVEYDGFQMKFDIIDGNKKIESLILNMTGMYNVQNALGVYALVSRLGVPEKALRVAFSTFKGIKRRLELKANVHNIFVIDDYAHHPKEVLETVYALERAFPVRRVIKVFQPHRFTRVTDLLPDFVSALSKISENLLVTDIFCAGESQEGMVTTEKFLDALEEKTEFQYVPRDSISDYLLKIVEPGDIVLMMGAGDITSESDHLANEITTCLV